MAYPPVVTSCAEEMFPWASVRILVVEDYETWRHHVCSILKARPELRVVREVADGSEAVEMAAELQPDLVLLDIGLPKLNGIEVAKRLRKVAPGAKILFVSQESSVDIIREAVRVGALGYVHKSSTERELLPAIEAVLEGRQFVSGKAAYRSNKGADARVPYRHEVQFYSDDRVFLESLARFVGTALRAGNPAIVLATQSHHDGLLQRLKAGGVDVDVAIQKGICTLLDAADTLSTFMVDDWPDPVRFLGRVRGLIESASASAKVHVPVLAAFGEMVALLWTEGKTDAMIRLEQLWSDLTTTHDVDVLCAYPLKNSQREMDRHIFQRICTEHSAAHSQ